MGDGCEPSSELLKDLADLRLLAGDPTTRAIAKAANVSHTSVAELLSGARLPSWRLASQIIEAMQGDPRDFAGYWQTDHPLADRPPPAELVELRSIRLLLERVVELLEGDERG